jgi:hypothetical protein
MKDAHTFEEMILSDGQFALLLEISLTEFTTLKRTGLYAYINHIGIIEEYFMYLYADNLQSISLKTKIGTDNFIRFSREEMQKFLLKISIEEVHDEQFSVI